MTDREAMKLALEALELWHNAGEVPSWYGRQDRIDAMNAIRQALAEPDMGIDRGAWDDVPDATTWVDELRGGDETEEEPVAWRNAAIRLGEDLYSVGPNGYYDMTASQWLDWALSVVNTAPPKQPEPTSGNVLMDAYNAMVGKKRQALDPPDDAAWAKHLKEPMSEKRVHESDTMERHVSYVCPQCNWTLEQQYDQTALELCDVCGWKTLIPDDGCLNCERGKPWIGLTDDEIWELYTDRGSVFARAIEAKLREKNGY